MTGGYDSPEAPADLPEDFGWVCLSPTDLPEGVSTKVGKNAAVVSRYPKLNPDRCLPGGWTHCVWLDGNVGVASPAFYGHVRSLAESGAKIALIRHPQRDDVFDEAERIVANGRETLCNMLRVNRFLKRSGIPRPTGLYEANVIFRALGDPQIEAFDDLWWECFSTLCRRDQMTLPYCLWKTGLQPEAMLPDGKTARNSPLLRYTPHDPPYRKHLLKDARRAALKLIYRILK